MASLTETQAFLSPDVAAAAAASSSFSLAAGRTASSASSAVNSSLASIPTASAGASAFPSASGNATVAAVFVNRSGASGYSSAEAAAESEKIHLQKPEELNAEETASTDENGARSAADEFFLPSSLLSMRKQRQRMLCTFFREEDKENFRDEVFCCLCLLQRRLEAAGRAFLEKFELSTEDVYSSSNSSTKKALKSKGARSSSSSSSKRKDNEGSDEEEQFSYVDEERWRSKRKGKANSGGGGGGGFPSITLLKKCLTAKKTLYEEMGVSESATTDEIKKRYRILVLEHHPDKVKSKASAFPVDAAGAGVREKNVGTESAAFEKAEAAAVECKNKAPADNVDQEKGHASFLKIQEAYEALSDSEFRRQYDSALPFDESVPSASSVKTPGDFFALFRPAFERNARWSARRPVPALGDEKTSFSRVQNFYDFWFNFQSWRDFGVHDEYDLNEAESREERRWMERENQKLRRKHVKAERARIQKLVETSYSVDPRVLQEKEAVRKKREDEKAARQRILEEQRRLKEEEELKRKQEAENEERIKREDERARQQEERQHRDCHKRWRQRMRQIHAHCSKELEGEFLDSMEMQRFCQKLSTQEMQQICCRVYDLLNLPYAAADTSGAPGPLPDFSNAVKGGWEKVEELFLFHWECMKNVEKAQEEEAAKEIARRQAERKAQDEARRIARQSFWSPDEMSMLAKGLQKFPGGTSGRWKLIADLIGTKTQEEVVEKTREMSEGSTLKSMGPKLSQVAFNQFKVQNQGAFKKIQADPDKKDVFNCVSGTNKGHTVFASQLSNFSEWTSDQQLALENALAAYPSTMPASERWTAIANSVPGKTKKECVERFKQVRAAILAKKAS